MKRKYEMGRQMSMTKIGAKRILIKDGPYGSMIQSYKLDEEGFRAGRSFNHDQKGNNDLLNLTRPDVVGEICNAYLDAGADIVATNTFNSNAISLSDYGIAGMAREINLAAAKLTRACADAATARDPAKPRFVAGALGPTNKTLSVSPNVNDPGYRAVTFDDGTLTAAYDGGHGWFWRNRTSKDVTVTLKVNGAYTSIKRMN